MKNVLVIKKIFNITHCLSKYLDSKCWYNTFKIMQKIEPAVRDELGLQSADEEYGHQLINRELKEEWGVQGNSKLNASYESASKSISKLRELVPQRKVSYDKEEAKRHSVKSVQQVRASRGQRKTVNEKQKIERRDISPLGRSKTATGHHRTTHYGWEEECNSRDIWKIDLEQINTSINTLFKTTLDFSDDLVQNMITGLGELIVNNVEEMSTPTTTGSKSLELSMEDVSSKGKKNLFSLRKLTEIVLVNIYRIEHFWQIIIDQLMVISICNNQDFRSHALEALMIIITETLIKRESKQRKSMSEVEEEESKGLEKLPVKETAKTKKLAHKLGSSDELDADVDEDVSPLSEKINKGISLNTGSRDSSSLMKQRSTSSIVLPNEEEIKWDDKNWQIKVLKPFCDSLYNTSYEKDQRQIVDHLKTIIQKCSNDINYEGWTVIISSLCAVDTSRVIEQVFVPIFDLLSHITTLYIENIKAFLGSEEVEIQSTNLGIMIESVPKFLTNITTNKDYSNLKSVKDKVIDPNKTDSSEELGEFGILVKFAKIIDRMHCDYYGDSASEASWKLLFDNIKFLYYDVHSSHIKRKLTLMALQDIIMNYAGEWSSNIWQYALDDVILLIYEKSITSYIDKLVGFSTTKAREIKKKETGPVMQTPTFSFGGPAQPAANSKGGGKSGPRRMRFDADTIQKYQERNKKEATEHTGFGMAPEETPKTFQPNQASTQEQELCLFVMDIFNDAFLGSRLENDKEALDIWILYVKLMTPLISNASMEILKGVLNTILFVTESSLSEFFYEKYDSVTLALFEEINSLIQRKTDLVLTVEVTELLINVFKQIYTSENLEATPQLMNPQNLNVTFHILRINLINSRPTLGLNAMRAENELKDDEKLVFDFIESMGELLKDNEDALKYYLSFLLNFINYDADEPHFEMFVRRTFLIISEWIIKDQYSAMILCELIPELFTKTSEIVNLRYHNTACMSLVFSMKASASLFETAGMFLLQISSHILEKDVDEEDKDENKFIRPNLQIEIPEDAEGEDDNNESSALNEKDSDEDDDQPQSYLQRQSSNGKKHVSSSLRAIDEEDSMLLSPSKLKSQLEITMQSVQDLVLNRIMGIMKDTLLFDISKIDKHNKAVKDAVIKSSQNLDVQIINFIINSLLPHASKLGKQFEHTLVSIIDKGCNGYLDAMSTSGMNIYGTSATLLGQSNSLSTYCFENLFELCSYKRYKMSHVSSGNKDKQAKLEEIKKKIARTTVPILLDRCKETLNKFLYDHGFTTLSLQRVEEAIFIIKKLKDLEVYPDVLCDLVEDGKRLGEDSQTNWTEDQIDFRHSCLKGTKAHLFILMPLFAELVTSKEEMIKEPLKDIFFEVAKASAITTKTKLTSNKGSEGQLKLF